MDYLVVKPEDFFLEKSSFKKHPNLNNIKNRQIDNLILGEDLITPRKKGNAYQYTKTGYRKDIDLTVRSSWEANFIRILNIYKISTVFGYNFINTKLQYFIIIICILKNFNHNYL